MITNVNVQVDGDGSVIVEWTEHETASDALYEFIEPDKEQLTLKLKDGRTMRVNTGEHRRRREAGGYVDDIQSLDAEWL